MLETRSTHCFQPLTETLRQAPILLGFWKHSASSRPGWPRDWLPSYLRFSTFSDVSNQDIETSADFIGLEALRLQHLAKHRCFLGRDRLTPTAVTPR